VLDTFAILETNDVDLAGGEGPVRRGQAHELPVCRPLKVQWTATVSPSAMTWWIS